MRTIGVRELRGNVSRVLRDISATGEIVEITRRGRVIARLVPVGREALGEIETGVEAVWADLDSLAEEIGARWPEGLSAAEAVSRDRR